MMKIRTFGKSWRIAALAALAAIGSTAPGALAGPIIVTGIYVPHGDPTFQYIFDVTLKPNYTLQYGDSFTIDGLPGVTNSANSPSYVSGSYSTYFGNASIDETVTTSPYSSDVTWTYRGLNALSGSLDLGTFSIYTTYNYPPGSQTPFPSGETSPNVTYTYSIGGNTGSDSFAISSVPEPSTILLLLIGGALPAGTALRRRFRRAG